MDGVLAHPWEADMRTEIAISRESREKLARYAT